MGPASSWSGRMARQRNCGPSRLCSSYRAEMVALREALSYLLGHPAHTEGPLVVCTDSQSALMAQQNSVHSSTELCGTPSCGCRRTGLAGSVCSGCHLTVDSIATKRPTHSPKKPQLSHNRKSQTPEPSTEQQRGPHRNGPLSSDRKADSGL